MSVAAASSTTTWDDCVGAATWLHEPLQRILSYPNPLPVQQAVIPTITRALLSGVPNDVSLTAPTGSGKTLCYLLPLLRLLTETKKGVDDNALRCLILVPSPALGQQVHRELQRLTRPTSIRVACICAEVAPNASTQDTDAAEAKMLVRRVVLPRSCLASARARAVEMFGDNATGSAEDGNSCPVSDADSDVAEDFMASDDEEENGDDSEWKAGGSCPAQVRDRASTRVRYFSNADVVVATPQRLLHHLDHTRGLRLVDLRLFVIDEADQVLVGNFASQVQKVNARYEHEVERQQRAQQRQQQRTSAALTASLAAAAGGTSTSASSLLRFPSLHDGSSSGSPAFSCLHKVLCSATLSSRIARIAQVKLRNCSYYVLDSNGEERKEEALVSTAAATTTTTTKASVAAPTAMTLRTQFALPPTLQEHIIFVEDSYRPAVLLKLVHTLRERIATVQRQKRRQAEAENSQEATTVACASSPSAAVDGVNTDYPATEDRAGTGVLIFCSTAEEARVMSHFLSAAGVTSVVEFTTLASEAERRRALLQRPAGADDNNNSNNTVSCVVASDALMRGIDIPNVGHVIMYHPPDAVSQYVHRAGRTARAMRPGHVHLLLSKTGPSGTQEDGEMALYRRLSQSLSRTLPVSYERYFFRFAEKPSRANAADGAAAAAEATASAVLAKAGAAPATAIAVGSAEWWVGQAEQFLVQSQHQLQRRWSSVLEAAAAVAAAAARKPAAVAVVDGSSGAGAPVKGVSAAPGQAFSSRKRLR